MDTTEVATQLGITPRMLRQFLRSPMSTFVAVGSGARYEFTEKDVPTIERRFKEWHASGKTRSTDAKQTKKTEPKARANAKAQAQAELDEAQWKEEGEVKLPDIRDPRIRARVKRDAKAAEDRLMMLLMSRGMHITQLGDRKIA